MIKRVQSSNFEINRIQDNLDSYFKDQAFQFPIGEGRLLKDITINTTDTIINHGLSREILGYIPVKLSVSAVIFSSTTANSRPQDQIILKSSFAVVASLWVF